MGPTFLTALMRHPDLKRNPNDSPGQRLKHSPDISRAWLLEGRRLCKYLWGYLTVAHSQKVRRTFCGKNLVRGRTVIYRWID